MITADIWFKQKIRPLDSSVPKLSESPGNPGIKKRFSRLEEVRGINEILKSHGKIKINL